MPGKLVLGFGGCVDHEVPWDGAALGRQARELGLGVADANPRAEIVDTASLLGAILGFLREGRGGEREAASSEPLTRFSSRHGAVETLGGTNVRAALALAGFGVTSTVHLASADETIRRLLPTEVEALSSAAHGEFHPHLIVQYPAGARVEVCDGQLMAPRANRVIVVHDPPNREMQLHPRLPEVVADADLVLVSGFNAVDDETLIRERATQLRRAFARLPEGALVHYEDAGFHRDPMRAVVGDAFHGLATVHGMNEDEFQTYAGRAVDLLDVADVDAALATAEPHLIAPTVVVHTQHWAAAAGPLAQRLEPALAAGIDVASARFCFGDGVGRPQRARVRRLPRQRPAVTFAAEFAGRPDRACVPARVLETPTPTTIGLGDAFVGGFLGTLAGSLA